MYIILFAVVFAIVFYLWSTIKNFVTVTVLSNTNITPQGFMWFGSLLLLNLVILGFVIWFYYNTKNKPGSMGKKGVTGLPGDNARDCSTC